MSLFGKIMDKIFRKREDAEPEPASAGAGAAATPTGSPMSQTAQPQPRPAASSQSVDVGAVLAEMAAAKGGGGNYKSSIVDLLKLLDLDSSLAARKQLGDELGVEAGEDGSAEQNIALHKAVMDKLAANGGVVPDELRN
jgi:hypothetical protein